MELTKIWFYSELFDFYRVIYSAECTSTITPIPSNRLRTTLTDVNNYPGCEYNLTSEDFLNRQIFQVDLLYNLMEGRSNPLEYYPISAPPPTAQSTPLQALRVLKSTSLTIQEIEYSCLINEELTEKLLEKNISLVPCEDILPKNLTHKLIPLCLEDIKRNETFWKSAFTTLKKLSVDNFAEVSFLDKEQTRNLAQKLGDTLINALVIDPFKGSYHFEELRASDLETKLAFFLATANATTVNISTKETILTPVITLASCYSLSECIQNTNIFKILYNLCLSKNALCEPEIITGFKASLLYPYLPNFEKQYNSDMVFNYPEIIFPTGVSVETFKPVLIKGTLPEPLVKTHSIFTATLTKKRQTLELQKAQYTDCLDSITGYEARIREYQGLIQKYEQKLIAAQAELPKYLSATESISGDIHCLENVQGELLELLPLPEANSINSVQDILDNLGIVITDIQYSIGGRTSSPTDLLSSIDSIVGASISKICGYTTTPTIISARNLRQRESQTTQYVGGPYKFEIVVDAYGSANVTMTLGLLNHKSIRGYSVLDNIYYIHPHVGALYDMGTSIVGFMEAHKHPKTSCLGELVVILYNAMSSCNLTAAMYGLLSWLQTADTSDQWGRNVEFFPTLESVDLTLFNKEPVSELSTVTMWDTQYTFILESRMSVAVLLVANQCIRFYLGEYEKNHNKIVITNLYQAKEETYLLDHTLVALDGIIAELTKNYIQLDRHHNIYSPILIHRG